ncbi:hypothetical protein FACS1894190_16920 [Spirochaetia bacterium]|nr:hypothetical protein FACS1894190_16920 [Spirochaetia bacterium]
MGGHNVDNAFAHYAKVVGHPSNPLPLNGTLHLNRGHCVCCTV